MSFVWMWPLLVLASETVKQFVFPDQSLRSLNYFRNRKTDGHESQDKHFLPKEDAEWESGAEVFFPIDFVELVKNFFIPVHPFFETRFINVRSGMSLNTDHKLVLTYYCTKHLYHVPIPISALKLSNAKSG